MRGTVAAVVRRLVLAFGAAACLAAGPPAGDRFDTVVIDPGHGGEDHGARARGGLEEKGLVLDVARRLAARLRRRGLAVLLTRERDEFVSLERRTALANDARGDLFVSIHANAAKSRGPRGSETFFAALDASDEAAGEVAARENRAFTRGAPAAASEAGDALLAILGDLIATEHLADSSEFARLVQTALARANGMPSRGVKQAPFVVLLGVQMPAALVEIGFLTNPADEQALLGSEGREGLVEALEEAVLGFGRRYDARRGIAAGRSLAGEEGH
jgi:N-acetylmuramoyl-L-alanine amidase